MIQRQQVNLDVLLTLQTYLKSRISLSRDIRALTVYTVLRLDCTFAISSESYLRTYVFDPPGHDTG